MSEALCSQFLLEENLCIHSFVKTMQGKTRGRVLTVKLVDNTEE